VLAQLVIRREARSGTRGPPALVPCAFPPGLVRSTFRPDVPLDGSDPWALPTYGIAEAAHYLRLPAATLRSWVLGRHYPTRSGRTFFPPLIVLPKREPALLSFVNLVEAHILAAIRREHLVRMRKVRAAMRYLGQVLRSRHPLLHERFETDGIDLFVERTGILVVVSEQGQVAFREAIEARLRRIERDPEGRPARLYLFTRKGDPSQPKQIVVDPRISFGRPVLATKGVPTAVVAERYKAGDSIASLADDYDCSTDQIEEAIRCELWLEAA
jgi:uncharacterized protein (DUF433 family)